MRRIPTLYLNPSVRRSRVLGSLFMLKRSIREKFLAERKSRRIDFCVDSSVEIQQRFLRSSLFQSAGCLALYSAIHNEVLTDQVFERAIEAGKTIVYPRVKNDELEFVEILNKAELVPGAFGVLEPQGDKLVPIDQLDLIVVPGVAFDQAGHRLGYGRGFYDRVLAMCRNDCTKVGFAYDEQLVTSLPVAIHDKTISALMTETCTLEFNC